ncbi:PQQ-dependent sugar dehydrogenase [Zavarzinella formosa]|uniref:PQQ-dependent sugar dehydrogenase n=1 Tax=Zavarzinella formosa TaxID=360055 RepID=UPI00030D6C6F|nr:sorbosone dehydrogenase family protein [Zavarzinella formosa]
MMSPSRLLLVLIGCGPTIGAMAQETPPLKLPEPFATPSVEKRAVIIGWPKDKTPTAPPGFKVEVFAHDIASPRWIYVLPNGDVLVAQSTTLPKGAKEEPPKPFPKEKEPKTPPPPVSPNIITLLRDTNGDGLPDIRTIFLEGLKQPLGMVLVKDTFFVGNTDALMAYPYKADQQKIEGPGKKILDLPGGGYNNHWTRNVLANKDGTKLYVSVGSGSNVAEHGMDNEKLRANILEVSPDGSGMRIFASGLRNPVGMAWEPTTGKLWTAVNERDNLGDDLVPDFMTSVQEGGFYGWPFSYFGKHEDPRRKGERPDLVEKAIVPDVPLGSHTASLGLAFYTGKMFPAKYQGGAFIGQRGSWNRSSFVGYRIAFVPFKDGKAAGPPEDFVTGFLANELEAYGRPVGVAFASDGSLLIADEMGNTVWRVSVDKKKEKDQ